MGSDLTKVGILLRREIEARIAGPLIEAFCAKMGNEAAMSVVRPVIERLALQSGRQAAEMAGGNTIESFAKAMDTWAAGDAFNLEVLELSAHAYNWNVTRCAYAEMYRELGLESLGYELSCGRDFAMVKGFNPRMELSRSQTIMQGQDHCDFRLTLK